MTGVERLRALAGAWDEWGLGGSLTEIADQIERELARHGEPDSTDNGARLLYVTDEDRDAAAWVREHGGLDAVKAEWRSRVPYDRYVRRRQRLLGHIAECETALGRRRRRIEELEGLLKTFTNENAELRRRAMPEGYEWPRYESDELVEFGDGVSRNGEDFEVDAIKLYRDGSFSLNFWAYSKGERVKRPSVLAADGEPLEVGQTVWDVEDGSEYEVCEMGPLGVIVECWIGGIASHKRIDPSQLTHTKPEIDSWERIEEDAQLNPDDYWMHHSESDEDRKNVVLAMARDILHRCVALAERERGE